MASLIYIADPMCSWCYGFGPELSTLMAGLPDTPLQVVVGGLRAYNTQVIDEELKQLLLSHWRQVESATGLPFSQNGLSRPGFVYDTEPACRAVVAARTLAPAATLNVLYAVQHAFYAQGRDVTQGHVLIEVACAALAEAGFPIDAATFSEAWCAEQTILATHADFTRVQQWSIPGFPTLVLERAGKLDLVTSGYASVDKVIELLQALIDQPT